MTLGIGVVVEPGAIVLTDSCLVLHQPDGSTREVIVDDKLLMAEAATDHDVRLVVVHSGPSPRVQRPRPLPDDGGDFEVAAANVWRELTNLEWADWVLAEHRCDDHDALIAGSVRGQRVSLVHMSNTTGSQLAADGSIFTIGLHSAMWRLPQPPHTLNEALIAGLALATSIMRRRIAEAARLGESAGVAWPLTGAVMTPERIDYYVYAEPHPQVAW